MKKVLLCGVLAALLSLVFVGPALAGAPDVQGQKPPSGVGGLPPQAPPEGGWTEYPPAPSRGTVQAVPVHPWPIGPDPRLWMAHGTNPALWLVDGMVGALTGILNIIAGAIEQPVLWLAGREVDNPYTGGQGQGIREAGVTAEPFNIFSYTDPSVTYDNPHVVELYSTMTGVAAFMLGLVVFITGGRELMGMLSGRTLFRGLGETFRRLFVGLALALIFAWVICTAVIDLNNLLIEIFYPWGYDIISFVFYNEIGDLVGRVGGLVLETALLWIVFTFAMLILAVVMTVRLVLLDILIILGPVAGMAYATPETEFLFTRWFNALISVTFYQFLSMLFLGLGFRFINMAAERAAENPILLGFMATICVVLSIVGPPIVGFAVSRAASAPVLRGGTRALSTAWTAVTE